MSWLDGSQRVASSSYRDGASRIVSGFSRIRHHVRKGIVSLRSREEAIVGVAFYGSGASLMLASWSHAHMTMSEYRVAHAVCHEATTDTLTADKRSTSRSEPEIEPIAATCTAVLFEVPSSCSSSASSSRSMSLASDRCCCCCCWPCHSARDACTAQSDVILSGRQK